MQHVEEDEWLLVTVAVALDDSHDELPNQRQCLQKGRPSVQQLKRLIELRAMPRLSLLEGLYQ